MLQVWFSHKRRKVKKDQEEAAVRDIIQKRLAEEKQQDTGAVADQPASSQQNGVTPAGVDREMPATAGAVPSSSNDKALAKAAP